MISPEDFVECARAHGFRWYSGVPCSIISPLINYLSQYADAKVVPASNEGDAVAIVAGLALGQQRGITWMQNSGLGNAVSPLTSLTWLFELPQLLIVTWRGQPGCQDEPQHELMGALTPNLLQQMEIPFELFPTDLGELGPVFRRATQYMEQYGRPYALLMPQKSLAPFQNIDVPTLRQARPIPCSTERLWSTNFGGGGVTRKQALLRLMELTPIDSTAVIAPTGYCSRELFSLGDRSNQFYMIGSMGCVSSLALGLALARPDLTVVAIDGDGAALMRMGALAMVGAAKRTNLIHILLDNGAHESTGGQPTAAPYISFAGVAASCGYAQAVEGDEIEVIDRIFSSPGSAVGSRFAQLSIKQGSGSAPVRPNQSPVFLKDRFSKQIANSEGASRATF